MKGKGIFCLEAKWYNDLRKKSSVRPILELLEMNSNIPYIYADCATAAEFEFFLKKWALKKYISYPILYLAFHGSENGIWISNQFITLDEISLILKGKCTNKIILFASCSTINIDMINLKNFLQTTDALAICGYKLIVPWIQSTALELMILSAMQDNCFDGRGIAAIKLKLDEIAKMFTPLEFTILTKKEI
ncbi:MAG: hypothetical protein APR54_09400 [Candidatus Cloacimonas sp. SDB]|nr:MAG: hypothetical protein APR54_09400 [Candidatus Cloacimonas sp. SDB]